MSVVFDIVAHHYHKRVNMSNIGNLLNVFYTSFSELNFFRIWMFTRPRLEFGKYNP